MPELIITAGSDMVQVHDIEDIDDYSYITLHGQMMFPANRELYDDWIWAHETNWHQLDAFVRKAVAEIKAGKREELPTREENPEDRAKNARIRQLADCAIEGARAGEVIWVLKRIFDSEAKVRGREPSVRQACEFVASNLAISPRSIRRAWEKYQKVAHLWAARNALRKIKKDDPEWLYRQRFTQVQLLMAEDLLRFFATQMTGRGEKAEPVLAYKEALRLPDDFGINERLRAIAAPFIAQFFPPLFQSEIAALKKYRASERQ